MLKPINMSLIVCLVFLTTNTWAMTIASEESGTQSAKPGSENMETPETMESTLHGNFTSLSSERLLKTSVGEFQLGASARVIDRRLDPEAPNKVTIRFRDNRIFEVTIYQ